MEGIAIKTKINLTTKRKTAYFKYLLNYCLHKWVHPNNCWKPKNISKKKKKKIKAKQEKQKIRKKTCTNQPMLFQEIHNLKTSAPLTGDELVDS